MKTLLSSAVLMAALSANALNAAVRLPVPSVANIFAAGHATLPAPGGGGAGSWPSYFGYPAQVDHVILFTNVSGTISLSSSLGILNDADGNNSFSTDISSFGGISGIRSDASGFLVGVFLGPAEPTDPAPPSLDFTSSGLGTGFLSLTPQIGQLFFIGDGRTGNGSGAFQQFIVPPTSTRIYWGFADAPGYIGLPGNYQDNVGDYLRFTLWFHPVPEPSSWVVFGLGAILLYALRRARRCT